MLLQKATGSDWVYVPYPSGSQRLVALLGGHVNIYVGDAQEVKEHIRSKAVRPLAIVGDQRLAEYPDVPTFREAGQKAGVDLSPPRSMRGVVAPADMPREAVQYWENVFERLTRTPAWRKYLEEGSMQDGFEKGAALAKSAAQYRSQQREVLIQAGVKLYR
jgi:putative tricarboxylic transport membrane protein